MESHCRSLKNLFADFQEKPSSIIISLVFPYRASLYDQKASFIDSKNDDLLNDILGGQ
jgi:hypothetical protein